MMKKISVYGKRFEVEGVTDDSRKVKKGDLFVAIAGFKEDGNKYIPQAIKNGAKVVIGEKDLDLKGAMYIKVRDAREALSIAGASWYDNPSEKLKVIGVTGTDGKTSTVNMIYNILVAAGKKVGMVSTVGAKISGKSYSTGLHVTNPKPLELNKFLSEMVKKGAEYAVLEVTSHGIDQKRVAGINFSVSVITNITPEHLDYHKTFTNYKKTKLKLLKQSKVGIKTYKLSPLANVFEQKYNQENASAAIAVVKKLGIDEKNIVEGLGHGISIKGRLEEVKNSKGIKVYVDYAHTPAAVKQVLSYLKGKSKGKLISLASAEGERDLGKRKLIPKIASKYSDVTILNPIDTRSEDPKKILEQMEEGASGKYFGFIDRAKAIKYALKIAQKGDTVAILGKGHETSMAIKGVEHFWSDIKVVKKILSVPNKVDEIRTKYPVFEYANYSWGLSKEGLEISFIYKANPDIRFLHKSLIKGVTQKQVNLLGIPVIDNLVFNIGLVEVFSYWKATSSPKIEVKAGRLDDYQTKWWSGLLIRGMGQYFYENNIDFRKKGFVKIESSGKKTVPSKANVTEDKILVPIGGGKDSAVTLSVLSKEYSGIGGYVVNPSQSQRSMVQEGGVDSIVEVVRKIDSKLLKPNDRGYLTGHIPYSAKLAFYGVFCSTLFGYRDIAFSNERSSDEANLEYLGEEINHQYSKTFEFENKFREYNRRYLSNVNYFSFLRPLYDIQITKVFSEFKKYHKIFRSCNVGQKTNSWCCECSKCLSTYVLMYPFFGSDKTRKIFGTDLYEDKSLKGLLFELVDEEKVKPFECVGTRAEIKVALYLSLKINGKKELPYLLSVAKREILEKQKSMQIRAKKMLSEWGPHNLSKEFEKLLKTYV